MVTGRRTAYLERLSKRAVTAVWQRSRCYAGWREYEADYDDDADAERHCWCYFVVVLFAFVCRAFVFATTAMTMREVEE